MIYPGRMADDVGVLVGLARFQFHPQSLAPTSWAFAPMVEIGLCAVAHVLWRRGLKNTCGDMAEWKPQELANPSWSFSALEYPDHEPLMESISAASIKNIRHFEMPCFAPTVWACASLLWSNEPLLDAISAQSIRKRSHASMVDPLDLRIFFWAGWCLQTTFLKPDALQECTFDADLVALATMQDAWRGNPAATIPSSIGETKLIWMSCGHGIVPA
eukprot:gnl/MRDRNA2_/MRDRNA2_84616_c0_seq1.p1 gnl/MRDRNA2_/MRDRNA2_84616_c0~~gnl/MRDRNA2_/MRDRNA2_84616_c0_seq1.p1  ORF type:complete len:216 (+),score=16.21 gnl/MRDRNA2_/MRDRNA2_84616_c0_seq1:305-952(+)